MVFVRGLVVHGVVEDAGMVAVALNLAKQRHPTRHTQIQPAPLFRPRFNDANLGRMQLNHRHLAARTFTPLSETYYGLTACAWRTP